MSEKGRELPVLMCHGQDDLVVRVPWALKSKKVIEDAGLTTPIDWQTYDTTHSVTMDEIRYVIDWIKRVM